MKPNFLFSAALLLLIVSCKSGSNTDQKAVTDSTKTAVQLPKPPAKPANVVFIWHKVSNFDRWLKSYESHDSSRLASGLHSQTIGRDVDNPNMVLVTLRMDDPVKAKAFCTAPDLKTAMAKGGVVGPPSISFVDIQMKDKSTDTSTTRLMIKHRVKDFVAWKKVFEGDNRKARTEAGLTTRALGYSTDDKNDISIVFAVGNIKKAKAFVDSKDLKDKMMDAGVIGKPTIHFFTVTKQYK